MKIENSDLMIVNRAVAHDNHPTIKRVLPPDENGKYRFIMVRQSGILPSSITTKDIQTTATKMLRQLPDNEASSLRKAYYGDALSLIVYLLATYANKQQVQDFAPNLYKLI